MLVIHQEDTPSSHSGDDADGILRMAALSLPLGDDSPSKTLAVFLAPEPARPIETQVEHIEMGGFHASAVGRLWADRERPTCGGLCDTPCTFRAGMCLVTVPGIVPDDLCPGLEKRLATA